MTYKNKNILLATIVTVLVLLQLVLVQGLRSEVNRVNEQNEINEKYNRELTEENNNLRNEIETLEFTIQEMNKVINDLNSELAEWRALVETTIIFETGHRDSYLYKVNNNHGGIKCGDEYCSYLTKEEGLQALETLLKGYVDLYGYDIKKIRSIYCPTTDIGCEGDYEKFIEIYESELKKYE